MIRQLRQQLARIRGLIKRSPAADRVKDSHLLLESMIPILGLYGIGPGHLDYRQAHNDE
ncbi:MULTISPECIES: hypothetical protein [Tatumella]|uniref:Uncharacterized protein n=1 Tax=Tatumella punctata TaxID=399969 RepID=A0ABW1VM98_9GAMM|nr:MULTISPECIES: hypothetical protein [unclassified Tatumella]MBS0855138.1 hypothetical protein [Tatumella sp. JGM16]MBS0876168.1 hypothetical protein [Tatumella sp. JGM82]MBS0889216.1 hypothetical protein [Tatumella sp. JGM94]MBS0901098.1 hypothetical protein [Tatumella sp. JGM100]MBS0912033.1 hypothetical protein [Tatumella sp. JGM91]